MCCEEKVTKFKFSPYVMILKKSFLLMLSSSFVDSANQVADKEQWRFAASSFQPQSMFPAWKRTTDLVNAEQV